MEPLGDYLKEVRENKRLSIEKVIEDTHILRKFIVGIEQDDFAVFPGEAYLKGFLRNYSEYLSLDPSDVIRRYEKIKLSETPSPIEQLIPKPGVDYSRIIFILVVLIALSLLGAGGFFIYSTINSNAATTREMIVKKEKPVKAVVEEAVSMKSIEITDTVFNLKKDEKVSLLIDDKLKTVWISNLEPTVIMSSSEGREQYLIGNNYTNKFDVNGDGIDDIEIILNFWDSRAARVVMRKVVSSLVINKSSIDNSFFLEDSVEILYKGAEKKSINIGLSISGDTYLRYQIDEGKEEAKRYGRGNSINLTGDNQIILWVSDAGSVTANFPNINRQIKLGEQGQLDVKIITWDKVDNENILQISSLR